ncbi:uncharacterized protein EDB91DRAFT_1086441 [Suillus paluster]|uniref:uncharacterized protein n=1 Tax=Suillus paluster TaxID=48578 RepID=UPI001B869B11|nr:uncharacterized protein EDB91DRAFT_1086441 [Suillus paluster]KAG1727366.1 hypothetical protein EDB91DRAFT_1086441 [Suillus paluster]
MTTGLLARAALITCIYECRVKQHFNAKLWQLDIRNVDNDLIVPQEWYSSLKRGTLVMIRATLHAFNWKERRKYFTHECYSGIFELRMKMAQTSHNARDDTLKIKLFNTASLDEGPRGAVPDEEAQQLVKNLLRTLMDQDGIHFVMYCVRGSHLAECCNQSYNAICNLIKQSIDQDNYVVKLCTKDIICGAEDEWSGGGWKAERILILGWSDQVYDRSRQKLTYQPHGVNMAVTLSFPVLAATLAFFTFTLKTHNFNIAAIFISLSLFQDIGAQRTAPLFNVFITHSSTYAPFVHFKIKP